jgi:hypothetical protein
MMIVTSTCCRHPDHYRRVRRVETEATVECGSPNTASSAAQLGIGAVKRAMLAIEVHRHPAVTAILDFRGIDGGLDLVATDRAPPAERELADYSG